MPAREVAGSFIRGAERPVTGLLNQACEKLEEARVVVFFV